MTTLTHDSLLELLKHDIPSKAHVILNKMKIVLTSSNLRWEFVQSLDRSKRPHNSLSILCQMRREQLQIQTEQVTIDFLYNYKFDPLQAISDYLLDNVSIFIFEDWIREGGTAEKLIKFKSQRYDINLIQALNELRRMNKVNT